MQFELKAIAQDGRVELLALETLDETSAVAQAEGRGYTVLAVRRRAGLVAAWHAGGRFPVVLFTQQLVVLLEAGLPLVDAIDTLARKERRAEFRAVLERTIDVLRQGQPLSAALQQATRDFPAIYLATVRASERTGDLPASLGRYIAYALQVEAVRKRLVNASIYPLLLVGVGGLVSLFLLLYVVPSFARIYEERAADLPVYSRLLLTWGTLVEGHAAALFGGLAAIALGFVQALRLPRLRSALGERLWRLPAVGDRLKVAQLARFYRTVGMLLRGGTPLVAALDLAAELLHPSLRNRLTLARRDIAEGKPVSASMEAHGLTTPVALRMLAVGEQGGRMGEMMDRIAAFHDEEIARWVDWFTRLFEPLLMAAIGLVIGSIVVLMYLPIFELAGSLR